MEWGWTMSFDLSADDSRLPNKVAGDASLWQNDSCRSSCLVAGSLQKAWVETGVTHYLCLGEVPKPWIWLAWIIHGRREHCLSLLTGKWKNTVGLCTVSEHNCPANAKTVSNNHKASPGTRRLPCPHLTHLKILFDVLRVWCYMPPTSDSSSWNGVDEVPNVNILVTQRKILPVKIPPPSRYAACLIKFNCLNCQ